MVYFKRKGNRNHLYLEILSHLSIKPQGGRHHNKYSTRADINFSLYIKCNNAPLIFTFILNLVSLELRSRTMMCLALTRSTHYLLRLQNFNAQAKHMPDILNPTWGNLRRIFWLFFPRITISCHVQLSARSFYQVSNSNLVEKVKTFWPPFSYNFHQQISTFHISTNWRHAQILEQTAH